MQCWFGLRVWLLQEHEASGSVGIDGTPYPGSGIRDQGSGIRADKQRIVP